jgi:hypothetical protein
MKKITLSIVFALLFVGATVSFSNVFSAKASVTQCSQEEGIASDSTDKKCASKKDKKCCSSKKKEDKKCESKKDKKCCASKKSKEKKSEESKTESESK